MKKICPPACLLPPAQVIDTTEYFSRLSTLPIGILFRILEKSFMYRLPFPTEIPTDEVRATLEFIISGTFLL